jgi:hypothetical protein
MWQWHLPASAEHRVGGGQVANSVGFCTPPLKDDCGASSAYTALTMALRLLLLMPREQHAQSADLQQTPAPLQHTTR